VFISVGGVFFHGVYASLTLRALQLLIEQRNYSHLSTYVFKAEAALDSTSATSGTNGGSGSLTAPSTSIPSTSAGNNANTKKKGPTEKEIVQTRLEFATALSHLGQGHYEQAALAFLRIGPAKELGDWIGKAGSLILISDRI
jgi:COP9 signalosome complex subunit 1